MPTMEPGIIRFGADDIERVEMVIWFKEIGPSEIGLPFGQEGADAEAESKLQKTLWDIFMVAVKDCAARGTLQMTYDPNDLVEEPESVDEAVA